MRPCRDFVHCQIKAIFCQSSAQEYLSLFEGGFDVGIFLAIDYKFIAVRIEYPRGKCPTFHLDGNDLMPIKKNALLYFGE
jgi:hypothetical protein